VRVEDGRNYVLGTSERYDVIHVGGFHPLRSSSAASFYTVEFFADCKRILNPGGHLGLWLPLHAMPTRDCLIILRSFHTAFPHGTVWHKHTGDCCLLLGRQEPLAIDFLNYEGRVNRPAVRAQLARCRLSEAYDLLDSFCMGPETLGRIVGEGRVQTDRHPYIEYDLNRARPEHLTQNLDLLEGNRERVWPYLTNVPAERRGDVRDRLETWFLASERLLRVRRQEFDVPVEEANAAYREVLALNPADRNAEFFFRRWQAKILLGSARSRLELGDRKGAVEQLRLAGRLAPGTRGAAEAAFLLKELLYQDLGLESPAAGIPADR
jgi:hypothetical protein